MRKVAEKLLLSRLKQAAIGQVREASQALAAASAAGRPSTSSRAQEPGEKGNRESGLRDKKGKASVVVLSSDDEGNGGEQGEGKATDRLDISFPLLLHLLLSSRLRLRRFRVQWVFSAYDCCDSPCR